MSIQKKLWNMQKFQFLLLTYWLDSPCFLKEVARDVVRTVSLCGNLQNMFFYRVCSRLTKFENFDAATLVFFGMYYFENHRSLEGNNNFVNSQIFGRVVKFG